MKFSFLTAIIPQMPKENPLFEENERPEFRAEIVLLLRRKKDGEIELGTTINPYLYSEVTPGLLAKVDEFSSLVGQPLDFSFRLIRQVRQKTKQEIGLFYEIRTIYALKPGWNFFYPHEAVKTESLPQGEYFFQAVFDSRGLGEPWVAIGSDGSVVNWGDLDKLPKISLSDLNKLIQP